jgi:NADPH:quinone reductase-like Zn-dependent oxidoreductase
MKALSYDAFGPLAVLKYGDFPDPQPGAGEILVQVKAASINPVDWKIRSGAMKIFSGSKFPKIPGIDFSGTVKGWGPQVSGWTPGQAVYGTAVAFARKPGACAELLVVPAAQVRLLPSYMNYVQAASLPVAGLTALSALRQCGDLKGKRVAVNGSTGGVGHFAVQIAKARGAHVTAIGGRDNLELAKKLGADAVVDYRQEDFVKSGQKADVIVDTHAHEGFSHFKPALTAQGRYVTTLPSVGVIWQMLWQTLAGGPRAGLAEVQASPEAYAELEALVKSGAVKPVIEQKFTLAQYARAFELLEAGKVRGKIVLEIA